MPRFRIHCALAYKVTRPTTLVLNILPARSARQRVTEERLVLPTGVAAETATIPGTDRRLTRITAEPGPLEVVADMVVETDPLVGEPSGIGQMPVGQLPFDALAHLPPSRYVPSDRLARLAQDLFGGLPPGFARVQAIRDWINRHVAYERGASTGLTTAADTFLDRAGVCRDFAHLGVAFCRALDVPARYVNAYAWRLHPEEHHAVFEVFLDGHWWLFDATGLAPMSGIVRIGAGRDAADVPIGTIHGEATPERIEVSVTALDDAAVDLAHAAALGLAD